MTSRIVHREYDGEHTSGGPDCACQPERVEVMLDALFDEVRELQAAIADYDALIDKIDDLHAPWHDDFCTQCGTQRCATGDLIAEFRSGNSTEESDHG